MTDDIDVRVIDHPQQPLGDLFTRLAQAGVERCDNDVQLCQRLIRVIQAAIRVDLHLAALQNAQRIPHLALDVFDFLAMAGQILNGRPAGDAQPARMVGNGDDFQPGVDGRPGHLEDGRLPIAPGRMGVQLGADVRYLQQFWQVAGFGRLHFAAVFTQLRRDPGEPQGGVDFLLAVVQRLPALAVHQRLLGQRQPFFLGQLADAHVVVFRAGRIHPQGAKPFGRLDP